ncbi:hypothetical protein EX895_000138 [Sporisorium graminicola]|uniref:Uncharacterized protein n=1 Tax=Sporisorium graminicola TaxID=280036 RepID=A0A4U7L000_9BASI|nr:hypothetical protein EX895_000138 [Sporisorium graminicola]TKY90140.1 hypothetical protein EX895_000138 [Sporisorium graminicola]
MSKAAASTNGSFLGALGADTDPTDAPAPEYRYQVEISQMMFVFADVVDPAPEVTKLVEDIVRSQTIEMIIQSRRLSQRRASKYLSSEDLIFLIRYDRAKVNRLRTYLSWKDVRKNAKDSGDSGGAPGGATEMDALDDPTGMDGGAVKATKMKIRLPWEISSIYSEHVLALPNADGDEDEDDDDLEAHEASMQRLKDADEATRRMTREEYVHYSECRQASFTFRKSKKFREFINASAYLDVKPNDDIIDILGFLAFEVVRELCIGAVAIKKSLEEQKAARIRADAQQQQQQRVAQSTTTATAISTATTTTTTAAAAAGPIPSSSSPTKRPHDDPSDSADTADKKPKLADDADDSADQTLTAAAAADSTTTTTSGDPEPIPTKQDDELCTLFTLPPTVETPLLASHIHEAFARLQRKHPPALTSGVRGSAGPGGLRRTRVFVI